MLHLLLAALVVTAGVDRAEQLYEQARYEDALAALGPSCEPTHYVSCERIRAFALIALGRDDEARAAFDRLLVHSPDATLGDDVSPKLSSLFNSAKRSLAWVMGLELEPVTVASPRTPWPLAVRPQNAVELARLRAFVSTSGTTSFTEVQLTEQGDAWVGAFKPDGEASPSAPRYYLVATLPSGVDVTLGDAQTSRPLALTVKADGGGDGDGGGDDGALGFFGVSGGGGGTGGEGKGGPAGDDQKIMGLAPWAFWSAAGGAVVVVTTVVLVLALGGGGGDTGDLRVNVQLGN